MKTSTPIPYYQRLNYYLVSLTIIVIALYYGQGIILPLLFSILLANILLPVVHFLSRHKFPKTLAIGLPLVLVLVTAILTISFLSSQILNFFEDLPAIKQRLDEVGDTLQNWFLKNTHITIRKQNQYIDDKMLDLKEMSPQLAGMTLITIKDVITYALLMPMYTFLILYYRANIKTFLVTLFDQSPKNMVNEILSQSTKVAQQYLTGLMIETLLVFVLNMAGFLILGIKYAVFLALLAALLNLIPYLGMLIANVLCMVITLVSSNDTGDVIWVGVILAAVQFLDNNLGMPLIVGTQVRINSLVTILGILVGGTLCGIQGMFLAIPALAILKVLFDKVPGLQPWGAVLGDEKTAQSK